MKKQRLMFRIAEIVLIAFFIAALITAGIRFTIQWYHDDISGVLKNTIVTMKESSESAENEYNNYQELCQLVGALSGEYLLFEEGRQGYCDIDKLQEMLDANGIYIVRTDGTVVQGTDDRTEWMRDRAFITYLENMVESGTDKPYPLAKKTSDDTDIKREDESVDESYLQYVRENTVEYLIASTISFDEQAGGWKYLVIRDDNSDLMKLNSGLGNTESILSRMIYGTGNQYIYARPRGRIVYTSFTMEENQRNVRDLGLSDAVAQDGFSGIVRISGKRYYCVTKGDSSYGENAAIIFCLPMTDIWHALLIVLSGEFAAMLFSFLLIRICFHLVQGDTPAKLKVMNEEKRNSRRTRFAAILILCCLGTGAITVFGNVLYIYADLARQCMARSRSLADSINNMEKKQDFSSAIYDHYMDRVTRVTAAMLSETPILRESFVLNSLSDIINVSAMLVYDNTGTVVSSSRNYNGLKISDDPESMSYEFRWLLHGKPILVQKMPDPDFLDQPYYFSGAPLTKPAEKSEEESEETQEEEEFDGFLQFAIPVSFHDDMVKISSLKNILSTNYAGENQMVFAVDTEEKIITSPSSAYDGFEASEAGFSEQVLADGFIGFMKLQRHNNIVCTTVCDRYFAIVAMDTTAIPLWGLRNGMILAVFGIAAELLYFALHMGYYLYGLKCQKEQGVLPVMSESEDQVEREQFSFCRQYLLAVALVITLIRVFSVFWLNEDCAAYFIFVTQWAKGLHIFAFTACLINICIAVFLQYTMTNLVQMLCSVFTPKQETYMRMALSFAKYIVALGTAVICADMLGAPTTSLLALSGIVTLMLSVGAQSLVADIIAGLFIIFEGTYKVGDMITVDDWHGKVIEIGIRNTKIRDLIESNVKIINNSTIQNIINYSEYPSKCSTRVSVDYRQNIEEIEKIFEREKETIMNNLPPLEGDIVLLGLDQFQDSGVILEFQVLCCNEIYPIVRRALNREIKEMFDRNGINIPFPQVVVSEREDAFLEKIKHLPAVKEADGEDEPPQKTETEKEEKKEEKKED